MKGPGMDAPIDMMTIRDATSPIIHCLLVNGILTAKIRDVTKGTTTTGGSKVPVRLWIMMSAKSAKVRIVENMAVAESSNELGRRPISIE